MPAFKSILAVLLLACLAGNALAYNGKATSYAGGGQGISGGGTGYNACGMRSLPGQYSNYFCALSYKVYGGHCGDCAKVCARGKCVTVMVVDECASCHTAGHIDLSEPAMAALTGHGYDMTDVTWEFTSCSGGGSVSRRQTKPKKSKKCKRGRKGIKCRRNRRGLLASEAGEQ